MGGGGSLFSNPLIRMAVNPGGEIAKKAVVDATGSEKAGRVASLIGGSAGGALGPASGAAMAYADMSSEKPPEQPVGELPPAGAPPTIDTPAVQAAGEKAVAATPRGRLATILTGGRGLDTQPYSVARRTLLGA